MAKHSIVIAHTYYSSSSSSTFIRRATPPTVFVTEPWMRCQNVRPNRESCAMTFISDRGYDVCPRGKIGAKIKRIDLTWRKTLTPRSSESGFHRSLKFATFEEAGRLCKTTPQNGVKVAPLGGRSVPKLPHWLNIAKKIWCLVAQRVDFTEMWNWPHLKRLAGSVRPYLKMG